MLQVGPRVDRGSDRLLGQNPPAPGTMTKIKVQFDQRIFTLEHANHTERLPLRTLKQPTACIHGQLTSSIRHGLR